MQQRNPVPYVLEIRQLLERTAGLRELYAHDFAPLVQVLWCVRHEDWRDRWVLSSARVH